MLSASSFGWQTEESKQRANERTKGSPLDLWEGRERNVNRVGGIYQREYRGFGRNNIKAKQGRTRTRGPNDDLMPEDPTMADRGKRANERTNGLSTCISLSSSSHSRCQRISRFQRPRTDTEEGHPVKQGWGRGGSEKGVAPKAPAPRSGVQGKGVTEEDAPSGDGGGVRNTPLSWRHLGVKGAILEQWERGGVEGGRPIINQDR